MKTKSLKVVMLAVALLSFVSVKAQTFVCSDITFSDYTKQNTTEAYRYQLKKQVLGGSYTVDVFDKNLKLKEVDLDGSTSELIFTKISENKYRFEDTMISYDTYETWKLRTDLEIQTVFGYYSSITIKVYHDGNLFQTVTAKRKK